MNMNNINKKHVIIAAIVGASLAGGAAYEIHSFNPCVRNPLADGCSCAVSKVPSSEQPCKSAVWSSISDMGSSSRHCHCVSR